MEGNWPPLWDFVDVIKPFGDTRPVQVAGGNRVARCYTGCVERQREWKVRPVIIGNM